MRVRAGASAGTLAFQAKSNFGLHQGAVHIIEALNNCRSFVVIMSKAAEAEIG